MTTQPTEAARELGLRWTLGASRRARYLSHGDPRRLHPLIRDLTGVRGHAERIALIVAGLRECRNPVPDDAQEAWSRAADSLEIGRRANAFLIYTGRYKTETVISGVVGGNPTLFVKVFRDSNAHIPEVQRYRLLKSVVPKELVLAPLHTARDGVVAYGLLERSRTRGQSARIQEAAITLGHAALVTATPRREREWRDLVEEVGELHSEMSATQVPFKDALALDAHQIATCHGDFTRWNTVPMGRNVTGLVDYERVARRAPFTDLWHLLTQARVMNGRGRVPDSAMYQLASSLALQLAEVRSWYMTYLLEELHVDLTGWVRDGQRHPQLRMLIAGRAKLFAESLNRLCEGPA
jgi:hypothetical protein